MRVSTDQIQQAATNTILDQQSELLKTQQQLGSGRRILTPADDPAGAARALDVDKAVQSTEQLQRNVEQADLRLRQEDSILGETNNVLQRVRELSVQGANATQGQGDRQAIAAEMREMRDELLNLANSQDGKGEHLFSGLRTKTEPFARSGGEVVYNGDQGDRLVQAGPNRQVASSHHGYETFMKIPTGEGGFDVTPAATNDGTARLAGKTVEDPTQAFDGPYELRFRENETTGDLEYRVGVEDPGATTQAATEDLEATLDFDADPITGSVTLEFGRGDTRTLELEEGDGIGSVAELEGAIAGWLDDEGLDGELAITAVGGDELQFEFSGADDLDVVFDLADQDGATFEDSVYLDNLQTVTGPEPFAEGEPIEFGGRAIRLEGTPESGDGFTMEANQYQSVFDTIDAVIAGLEGRPDDSAGQARLATDMYQGLENLDAAMDSVSAIRAETGARLNALESEFEANEANLLDLQTELSRVEDLDYAEAITRLQQQSVGLQAAQQSYVQIQGLTLFDYI